MGDRSGDPGMRRNYKLVVCVIVVIMLMITVPAYFYAREERPVAYPCHVDLSAPLLRPQFQEDGSVVDQGSVYPPGFYFTVNRTTRGCICKLKPCIRKCCGRDELLVKAPEQSARCEKNPEHSVFDIFTLPVYRSPGNIEKVTQDHFQILYGDACRHGRYDVTSDMEQPNELMVDGSIHLRDTWPGYIDASGYCLESLNGSEAIRTLVCFPDPEKDPEMAMFTFYTIGMIISIPFMVVTFLVYSILPELRNLHGISLMCHSAVLLTGYLFLSIIQIRNTTLSQFSCTLFAFIVQFSFLASFFWLNVMCIDIWCTIRGKRSDQGSKYKKFLLYSLYAWGVPSVIVAISVCMDFIPGIPDSHIKPGFGVNKCWFADRAGTILYFYLPIAVVVLFNMILFVSTAIKLRAYYTQPNEVALNTSESRRTTKNNRNRFDLYLKLFIIMGITWVMELLSFFVEGPKYLWIVTDLCNTLQGVIIFVIFVCKRRILRLLNEKLCPQWQIIGDTSTSGPNRNDSRTNTDNLDSVALKPIARDNQYEDDE